MAFSACYVSPMRIDLCVTSCAAELDPQMKLPKEQPGYVRAHLDLWAWRLERADDGSTSVKFAVQANPQGWIPSYIPNSLTSHTPNVVMHAYQYFVKHGAPPSLIGLERGELANVAYDTGRESWRCEYTRSSKLPFTESKLKPDATPSTTKACVRLGARYWKERGCTIVIDPPPSKVFAETRPYDVSGVWIHIEHDEEHIIPQLGKILVLIKPRSDCDPEMLLINGELIEVQKYAVSEDASQEQDTVADSCEGTNKDGVKQGDESLEAIIRCLAVSPADQAQSALSFLVRIADQQFGWVTVSEKNGLQISKRSGSKRTASIAGTASASTSLANSGPTSNDVSVNSVLEIPETSIIVKATKVIEGYSMEEVASIVADIGSLRKQYDESLEDIESLCILDSGCRIIRKVIKAIFPFK